MCQLTGARKVSAQAPRSPTGSVQDSDTTSSSSGLGRQPAALQVLWPSFGHLADHCILAEWKTPKLFWTNSWVDKWKYLERVNNSHDQEHFTWEQKRCLCKASLWIMTLPSGRLLQAGWEVSFGNTETKDKICVKECYIILPCYVISALGNQITRKRMKTYGFGELGSLASLRNKLCI